MLKGNIEKELRRLEKKKTIKQVETSEWARPIVSTLKSNGDVIICADYKITMNPQIIIEFYPIPYPDHLLTEMQNGDKYTKIDLKEAFQQVPVDEKSH